MPLQLLKLNIDVSDDDFDLIYPESIRKFTRRHWTPVAVAKLAAEYLAAGKNTKILDIGSGAGKFCMVGAATTTGKFTGIEQRKGLHDFCVKAARVHHLENISFLHGNITELDFSDYDAFYFYNSFRENIDITAVIDDSVETGVHLMDVYSRSVHDKLAARKPGTRLATYWTRENLIPSDYRIVSTGFNGLLMLYEKIR